jgi:benzylsuccinate CoA-transferase BbsF subunit
MGILKDTRILDLSRYMAGPFCTWILGDLGAEVIKIESCRHPDALRIEARGIYPGENPGEKPWNRSGMINDRNRNKYGITLDLTMPRGKEIFKKLVKISHVVVENFHAGVLDKLGIDYGTIRTVNPSIVLISLSSQGLTGPEGGYRSFGPTIEETGGLLSITGYPEEPPYLSTLAFPDILAGMSGSGLVLAALRYSRRTGKGLHIDLSQRELTTAVIGEAVMDYVMNKRIWSAKANRHPFMAPHGCYRCKGEDKWVTIAVGSDRQWKRLCRLMGRPELTEYGRFGDILNRCKHHDEIDQIIEDWTKNRDQYEVQNRLQEAGIAAGAVLNAETLFKDPHLKDRNAFNVVTHPEAGIHAHVRNPIRLSKNKHDNPRPAPCLGEHNAYVLGNLLGMAPDEMEELDKTGVIGTIPTNVRENQEK